MSIGWLLSARRMRFCRLTVYSATGGGRPPKSLLYRPTPDQHYVKRDEPMAEAVSVEPPLSNGTQRGLCSHTLPHTVSASPYSSSD